MNIDSIKNGYVIDHIKAGKGMQIYDELKLDELDCPVAIIKNAKSNLMGQKDIIKVDTELELNVDILGYIDSQITINVVRDCKIVKKYHPELPEQIENIVKCKNPRCITTTEQEINQIFILTDKENRVYRCKYCDSKAK